MARLALLVTLLVSGCRIRIGGDWSSPLVRRRLGSEQPPSRWCTHFGLPVRSGLGRI